jgi:toxin HigB-1
MEKVALDKVRKKLKKIPIHIVRNLQRWALQVETLGIVEVRKIPGYHDEPLSGKRKGQRSVRLSIHYRLFYVEVHDNEVNLIQVEEVNKHEY